MQKQKGWLTLTKDTAVLVDTNIALDWLLAREPFHEHAKRISEPCLRGALKGYLASHTLLNVFFIARKEKTVEERKEILLLLCKKFEIVNINKKMIIAALNNQAWNDLEDGLQMHCAVIRDVDYIITRDPTGFTASQITVLSPETFIEGGTYAKAAHPH